MVSKLVPSGWVTLCSFPGRNLFKCHTKFYKDWTNKFVRVRGQDYTSMVMAWATSAPHFQHSWEIGPKIIIGFDFIFLNSVEKEVVQMLNEFKVMSSRSMITLGLREDNDGSLLGRVYGQENTCFKIVSSLH